MINIFIIIIILVVIVTIIILSVLMLKKNKKLLQKLEIVEEKNYELEQLVSVDYLTQLYNRRYFIQFAEKIFLMSQREKLPLSIVMIDIDYFKKINDKYGHKIGDDVLVLFALKLSNFNRKNDIVCRYGGEEFIVMLSNCNVEQAYLVAQKMARKIKEIEIKVNSTDVLKVEVSMGISENRENDSSIEDMVKRADKELYKAKRKGRNRIEVVR